MRRLLFCALTTGLFLIGLCGAGSLGPSTTDEASASLRMLQLHYYS